MERRVIQEFIEIYRNEQSLWKVRSSYYNNKAIKNIAYRKMVSKLREIYPEADVELVKRKINALRTNYRKELRKVEASKVRNLINGEPVYVPSLWYYELFHFIADQESDPPIIDVTDGVDAQEILRVDFEEQGQFDGEEMSDEFEEEASSPESQKNSNNTMRQFNKHNLLRKRPRGSSFQQDEPSWHGRRQPVTEPDEPYHDRRQPVTESEEPCHGRRDPVKEPDGPDVFGRYVASKLRQMDKQNQMLSERLISEVLFRGQMQLLSRNSCLIEEELNPTIKVEDN